MWNGPFSRAATSAPLLGASLPVARLGAAVTGFAEAGGVKQS